MTARVVRAPELWRMIDQRIRRAIANDAEAGTLYAHGHQCSCPICERRDVRARLDAVIERAEAETRQELVCDDDVAPPRCVGRACRECTLLGRPCEEDVMRVFLDAWGWGP